ncbi:RING-finger-containing E3 ubiquitin ligase [Phanerochaete sordida]|uniref:Postreplication repair E3 ubiquitin-protein ligase RAD18 n=1 Tax=Phanerochaete sordida TaxID=48140 RepID=A0A9P3G5H6_9APHY|nr:RING-finger-containing E3 ubiquitin ligase [Phanerochaete sordida]
MSDAASKFLDADIPDPTDFSADAPGLRQLDEALRCTMCRELFQAPVTVNCTHGHCFCSYCIRDALATKPECPLCRGQISEVQIRKNPAMEDAVKAWNVARPFVLQILRERADAEAAAAARIKASANSEKPKFKKRKITSESNSDDDIVEIGEPPASSPSIQPGSSSVVLCPLCNKNVPLKTINNHIDAGCPSPASSGLTSPCSPLPKDKGKQKQQWSQLFQGAPAARKGKGKARGHPLEEQAEPLPKIAYDTVTQKRLRDVLEEYGLAATGDRQTMAARHARFVNMYNANLDASEGQRKSVKQLQIEMKRWDEAEEKRKTRKKVDAKDIDSEEYQRENKSTFAKLVQAARAGAQKRPTPPSSSPLTSLPPESSPVPPENGIDSSQQSAENHEVMVLED